MKIPHMGVFRPVSIEDFHLLRKKTDRWTYGQTNTRRDGQTDSLRAWQTDTQTNAQTYGRTDGQTDGLTA